MYILLGPFSFFLHSGKATNCSPCSWLLLRTVFYQIKTSFLKPKNGLKICPFPLFGLPSICISITYLCYDSALGNRNGCKVNMLGTQGMSPWIKLPSWKWSWWGETQPPAGSSLSTVCDLLTVRDFWVLWTSLRAPLLQQPATWDYLSPVRLHRQNWKGHMYSDSMSPSMLQQQGARSSRPSEKANCWHSQFSTPLSKDQALFSPSCLQKISFIIFHFLHFAGY